MDQKSNFVFLLGAGRSGTTLLYKLLSAHRDVAYLSNYLRIFPELPLLANLQRLLNNFPNLKRNTWFDEQGNAYFNRQWLHSMVPTPSECESLYASCGIPSVPSEDYCLPPNTVNCLRERFERILHASGAQVLLSKRTANNRRISILNQIFPNAKYIHLVRDGRAVAHSLLYVKWWNDHILYWTGKSPRQMIAEGADPVELAAQQWVEEMYSIERGVALLQKDQLLDVKYDELLRDPCDQLHRILDFMGVTPQTDTEFWELIKSLHLIPKQESWSHDWSEEELNKVLALQGGALRHWGFLK